MDFDEIWQLRCLRLTAGAIARFRPISAIHCVCTIQTSVQMQLHVPDKCVAIVSIRRL